MNPFDLVLLVLIVVLAVVGAVWGIVRIGASLLGFLLAFFVGLRVAPLGPDWFSGWIASAGWARLAAFFVAFCSITIGTALVAYGLRRFIRAVLMGWADRVAGAVAGLLAALLIGAALTVPLTALPPHGEPLLEDSLLAPYSLYAADMVRFLVPADLERQYREKAWSLRRAWERRSRRGGDGGGGA
ncbi:MAG: CvpA family protein [Acidobacteriota bacterium]